MAVVSLPACRLDKVHAVMNHSGIPEGFLARASRNRDMKSRELYWAETDFSFEEMLVRSLVRAKANVMSGKVFVGDRRLTMGFLAQNFSIHGIFPAFFGGSEFPTTFQQLGHERFCSEVWRPGGDVTPALKRVSTYP